MTRIRPSGSFCLVYIPCEERWSRFWSSRGSLPSKFSSDGLTHNTKTGVVNFITYQPQLLVKVLNTGEALTKQKKYTWENKNFSPNTKLFQFSTQSPWTPQLAWLRSPMPIRSHVHTLEEVRTQRSQYMTDVRTIFKAWRGRLFYLKYPYYPVHAQSGNLLNTQMI